LILMLERKMKSQKRADFHQLASTGKGKGKEDDMLFPIYKHWNLGLSSDNFSWCLINKEDRNKIIPCKCIKFYHLEYL
jgi:hypothetical protein